MAKQLQLRRGTTLEHSTFTGANGEITVDTDKDTVVVHDGITTGGYPLATENFVDTIADLRATTKSQPTVWVSGYHTKGDGAFGSNIFEWDATSIEDDNGGTIIKLASVVTGRYKLRYNGAVNVEWFGADNTGVVDSSIAIQTAIDNFLDVTIPDGVFLANTTLDISADNISISGTGTIRRTASSGNILNIIDLYSASFRGFTLEATTAENTVAGMFSNTGVHMSNSIIEGVTFRGLAIGVSIEGKNNSFNDYNYTVGALSMNLGYKSATDRDAKNIITNCVFENSLLSTPSGSGGNPQMFLRGSFWRITNNFVRNCYGPAILGGSDSIISGNIIVNMLSENGIYVSGSKRTVVSNNHIENVKTDGIACNASSEIVVSNNYLEHCGNAVFRVQDGCENILIDGNNAKVNGSHFVRGYMNPDHDGATGVRITNNIADGLGNAFDASPIIFQDVTATFRPTNVVISNNTFNNFDCSAIPVSYYESTFAMVKTGYQCEFTDNTFNEFVKYTIGAGGIAYFNYLFKIRGNNIMNCTDGTIIQSKMRTGAKVSLGGAGAISSAQVRGSMQSVTKGAAVGEYILTFNHAIKIDGISVQSSGPNQFDTYRYTIPGATVGDYSASSISLFVYNLDTSANEVAVNPHYSCAFNVNIIEENPLV